MLIGIRTLVATALLATVTSSLTVFPHELVYFNELSGGPQNGHQHLLHSNLDWGQDYLITSEWLDDHHHSGDDFDSSQVQSPLPFPCRSNDRMPPHLEIVSANKVFSANSVYRPECVYCRVGFTTWVFRNSDSGLIEDS